MRTKADPQALHNRLIRQACATGGWKINEKDNGWRKAFRAMLQDSRWDTDRADMIGFMAEMNARPDAWRMSVDDDEDMLLLEFLEVEVWHRISDDKKTIYQDFWWRLDASDGVRLQIWRMDRFGIISQFMTEETIHTFMDVLPE